MHPILFSLRLGPEAARVLGVLVAVGLALMVAADARKVQGGRRALIAVQALAVLGVGVALALALLTRERLGDVVAIDIRAWGALGVVTVVSAFLIQRRLGRALGVSSDQLLSIWVYAGLGGLVGARLLHVVVNASWYAPRPLTALFFWDGGLVYIGGLLGALGVVLLHARAVRLPPALTDVLVLSLALTQGIGRLGCFFAGCCFGRETTLPWGARFGEGSIALFTLKEARALAADAGLTPPLHPTQLYEAALCFLLGGLLLRAYLRGARPGAIVCAYLAGYSVMRFFLELLRDDPERQFLFRYPAGASPLFLSTSQTAALLLFIVALVAWRVLQGHRESPATRSGVMGSSP